MVALGFTYDVRVGKQRLHTISRSLGKPKGSRIGVIGAVILGLIILACFATLPYTLGSVEVEGVEDRRYEAGNLELNLLPPSLELDSKEQDRIAAAQSEGAFVPTLVLGTDKLGRGVFGRLFLGGAVSLGIGLAAALIAITIGTLYGAASGYLGGRTDAVLMRFVDILYGLPYILLVVLFSLAADGVIARGGLDPSAASRQLVNVLTLLVAIGGVSWLTIARVVRGQVLSLREQPFMEACRALGIPPRRQFLGHLVPNLIGPIVVYGTLAVPAAILSESFLSFLGIGVEEPLPSWGNLASEGLSELNTVKSRWWLLAWPCVLIAVTLISLNLLGDALKSRFDPVHRST